ncbi:hypothetical protein JCM8202v2_001708 [Rhodotorula sphaerocarpa]
MADKASPKSFTFGYAGGPIWGASASAGGAGGGGLSAEGSQSYGPTASGALIAAQASTSDPPPSSPAATPARATSNLTSSDLETLTSSSSPSVSQQTPRQAGPSLDAGWTAKTSSAAMKELVAKRAEIFKLQRTGRDLPLQASCFQKVSTTLQPLKTSNRSPYLSAFRNYAAFCKRMDVPVFPITDTLGALWMFEKCSTSDGYFKTYKSGLSRAFKLSDAEWKDQPVYQELSHFDPDATALTEFMEERRLMHRGNSKPKTAAGQPPDPSERAKPRSMAGTKRASRSSSEAQTDTDTEDATSSDSDSEDSDYEEEAAGTAGEGIPENAQRAAVNPPVPGLPTRDDLFASETDVFKAYVAALVPVFGISVTMTSKTPSSVKIRCNRHHPHWMPTPEGTCGWVAVAKKVNHAWKIDFEASVLDHSHGPCKEILDDPSWRPPVFNPHAREALGLLVKADAQPVPKQAPQQQKKQRVDGGPSDRPLAQDSPADAAAQTGPSASARVSSTGARLPPTSGAQTSAPPTGHVAIPQAPSSGPDSSTSKAASSPALPCTSEDLVRTFCAGLHPSLVSLAPALLSAGISSLDDFVSLRAFHPDIRMHFLDIMRREWNLKCESDSSLLPISLLQLNLFSKHLAA